MIRWSLNQNLSVELHKLDNIIVAILVHTLLSHFWCWPSINCALKNDIPLCSCCCRCQIFVKTYHHHHHKRICIFTSFFKLAKKVGKSNTLFYLWNRRSVGLIWLQAYKYGFPITTSKYFYFPVSRFFKKVAIIFRFPKREGRANSILVFAALSDIQGTKRWQ